MPPRADASPSTPAVRRGREGTPGAPARPRLVTIDLDDTLIEGTTFQALARHIGGDVEKAVRRTDDLHERGLMSLEACFLAQYDLFYGRPIHELLGALDAAPWIAGAAETVARLRSAGARVAVLTDQPDWAVASVAGRFGFDDGICTQASVRDGRVGVVTRHNFDKLDGLKAYCRRHRFALAHVAHVGNGVNDVPVFARVGRSVAFNPTTDAVADAADAVVRSRDLRDVLAHLA